MNSSLIIPIRLMILRIEPSVTNEPPSAFSSIEQAEVCTPKSVEKYYVTL